MKHPERIEDYLEHIAEAIARATDYLQHTGDLAAFQRDHRTQDAVVRNIQIIAEAVVAFELAAAVLEKFGGDSLTEITRNFKGFLEQVRNY